MRHPESHPTFSNTHRARRSRRGPGQSAVLGLIVVALGLLVAFVGAQFLVSALGPAGAMATEPALIGAALIGLGGGVECLGVAIFSKRFVSANRVYTATAVRPEPVAIAA